MHHFRVIGNLNHLRSLLCGNACHRARDRIRDHLLHFRLLERFFLRGFWLFLHNGFQRNFHFLSLQLRFQLRQRRLFTVVADTLDIVRHHRQHIFFPDLRLFSGVFRRDFFRDVEENVLFFRSFRFRIFSRSAGLSARVLVLSHFQKLLSDLWRFSCRPPPELNRRLCASGAIWRWEGGG